MGNINDIKKHLVSFSTPQYRQSHKKLEQSALKYGIDTLHSFTQKDLKKTNFWHDNRFIFKQERGFGYWLWKPYLILEVLKKVNEDDIVMYADAGNEIITDLIPLFNLCMKQNIILFQVHDHLNKTWTKRDAFVLMNCNAPQFYEAQQVCGSPQLYRVCSESIKFVETWLQYCCNPLILTDSANTCGFVNDDTFKDHRHDQSILTLLAIRQNIKIHRDPSQFGNGYEVAYPDSIYQQLINLHRTKHYTLLDRALMKIKRIKNYSKQN